VVALASTTERRLTGILFVLKSGILFECCPKRGAADLDMSCWQHLKERHEVGVWDRLRRT
jgi:hypothetical protein